MAQYIHFSQEERCVLAAFLQEGLSFRAVARKLRRSVGGISMEIARSSPYGSRERYDPYVAHLGSRMKKWDANRRNPMKDEKLRTYIREKLREGWSPEIIAGRLRKERGTAIVSHETIYRWAYQESLTDHLPRVKPRRHRKRWRLKASRGTQGLGPVPTIGTRPEIVLLSTEIWRPGRRFHARAAETWCHCLCARRTTKQVHITDEMRR